MNHLIYVKKELKTKTLKELAKSLGYKSPTTIYNWLSKSEVTSGGIRRIEKKIKDASRQ